MGVDKARLLLDGEPLVRRAARALGELCDQVLVASGTGDRFADLGLFEVADIAPEQGPLAGILAGLECADHDLVAVLAVDVALPSVPVLRLLGDVWAGEAALVPEVNGRSQPLHAVWARAAAPVLRSLLEAGQLRVGNALAALGARIVEPGRWGQVEERGDFALNLNRPADLGHPALAGRLRPPTSRR